ncbi:MAG: hypothetical protein E7013_02785 [Alphaproteobacteria bacterium]|nr:hypothetical protein [Alphaproteobacteria bacterium]
MDTQTDFYQVIIERLFKGNVIAYPYERIMCDEYEALIDKIVDGASCSLKPSFIQVSGIPGAGKSTFCARNYSKDLLVQFDTIMGQIPSYQHDCQRLGLVQSFSKWEMPARVIGYEVIRRLIAKKASFVLEHSGLNSAHLKLGDVLKNQGYETQMQFLFCDFDEACRRAKERELKIKRHTPVELIKQRCDLVLSYLEQYKLLMDKLDIWDLSDVNNWQLKECWEKGIKIE